jgi:peroxiredoxin
MIPEFTAVNYPEEKQVSGKEIVGSAKVTALVFFNTGCSSCLAELTEASAAVKAVNDPAKLAVYGIAVDKRGAKSVAAYDESNKFNVKYLLDADFKIPPMFGFRYTPAMVIVDKSGKIMEVKGGFDPAADKGTVQKLLTEMAQ